MNNALISVYNKTGIVSFAKELCNLGFTVISTGGTYKKLEDAGVVAIKHVSDVTKFPEILEGRIKTEHPTLIGGILAIRDKKEHIEDLKRFGIDLVDLVVCNLYPFEKIFEEGVDLKTALEYIDIGGPNMIRAAAKNFVDVIVVVDPRRYSQVLKELKVKGNVTLETRKVLAVEAFKVTAQYDSTIYNYLKKTFYL